MGKKSKSKTKSSTKKRSSSGSSAVAGFGRQKKKVVDPFGTHYSKSTTSNVNNQSIFHTYKVATQQFKEELSNLVPPSIFEDNIVQNFVDAVDYVQNHKLSVTEVLLKNLRTAISVRKKYASQLYGGDDEGHAYFILVLNYCLQVLKGCNRAFINENAVKDEHHGQEEVVVVSNRFDALKVDEDFPEESDNESDENNERIPRPEAPEKTYSLNDLNSFTNLAKCLHLFHTLELNASKMKNSFQKIKEILRWDAEGKLYHSCIEDFIVAGAYATSSMLEVQKVERSLYIECPDLDESPYRVLAVTFMSMYINILTNHVKEYSPLSKKYKDIHSIAFVGDIVECAFKCQINGWQTVSEKFVCRWKLSDYPEIKLLLLAGTIFKETMKNSMCKAEECKAEEKHGNMKKWAQDGIGEISNTHSWLEGVQDGIFNLDTINREHSILNTMKILDIFASNTNRVVANSNTTPDNYIDNQLFDQLMLGSGWDEDTQPAIAIRGDLDSLVGQIVWSIMESKWRFDSSRMPKEEVMLPLVRMIRQWTATKMKTPSFALTFGVHLVLMSVYAIQGDGDIAKCARISEVAFEKFYHQVKQQLNSEVPCSQNSEQCLNIVLDTKRVTQPSDPEKITKEITHPYGYNLLVWNPLSAMCLLSYQSTYLNLEAGFAILNDSSNVATVLHLYNALKVRELIDEDEIIPILTELDTHLSGLKVFWNGWEEKPKRGKFTYRFFLSEGFSHESATWFQNRARYIYGGGSDPGKLPKESAEKFFHNRKNSQRVSVNADPADVSEYFKLACREGYGANNPRDWVVKLLTEMGGILKYNMLVVGQIFHEFLYKYFKSDTNLKLKKCLEIFSVDNPGEVQQVRNVQTASDLLGALDYVEDQNEHRDLAKSLIEFFRDLDMNRVLMRTNQNSLEM